jgi:hypothetical protein
MSASAFSLAFFGFLRVGEFTELLHMIKVVIAPVWSVFELQMFK